MNTSDIQDRMLSKIAIQMRIGFCEGCVYLCDNFIPIRLCNECQIAHQFRYINESVPDDFLHWNAVHVRMTRGLVLL